MRSSAAVLSLVFLATGASAAPLVMRDTTAFVYDFAGISTTPAQTYVGALDRTWVNGVWTNRTASLACSVLVAGTGCRTPSPPSASYEARDTILVPGVLASSEAISEHNFQDTISRVRATAPTAVSTEFAYRTLALEGQQLRVNYAGGASFPVPLLMEYAIEAIVEDSSAVALGRSLYLATARAEISIVDSRTYVPRAGSTGEATAPLRVSTNATVGNFSQPGGTFDDQTVGFFIRSNVDYWVQSLALTEMRLYGRTGGVNLAGLDVSMFAAVDPIFSIDPVWIAANPDLASQVSLSVATILSPSAVPEPSSLALLAAAGLIGAAARSRRTWLRGRSPV